MLYLLFFCSGASGLIYQVIWVREFGNVFGNTVYSASMVISLFMLGLGVGSYWAGAWADRRYLRHAELLVRDYGVVELVIAAMGFAISAVLPHLGQLSAVVSSYSPAAEGWHQLSVAAYVARGLIATLLLAPITMLMGGTLTLLIRHHVHADFEAGTWRIALLYFVNTAGAAGGCLLTDLVFVPAVGLFATQLIAIGFNLVAALGALRLAQEAARSVTAQVPAATMAEAASGTTLSAPVRLIGIALGLSGFAAMGMEIVWIRHFTLLLGGLRAVYSMLLSVILFAIAFGALLGGLIHRRTLRPAQWLIAAQGAFVALTLWGLASVNTQAVGATAETLKHTFDLLDPTRRTRADLWFNLRPLLIEVAGPALMMGLAFPLANSQVQRAERAVGRRAGALYLVNTLGAVCGALAAGFLLLPSVGLQTSTTIMTSVALLAIVPLATVLRADIANGKTPRVQWATAAATVGGSLLVGCLALAFWVRLPPHYVIVRSMVRPTAQERVLDLHEGVNEVVVVSEEPDEHHSRFLITDGHPMSSTAPTGQRYMRALAHLPLLSIEEPRDVLVIGFGVGNTAHAASLHPSVVHIDIADLSKDVLRHAVFFNASNQNVLHDGRVTAFINDGRQHLQMRPPRSYDLIVLEPPPLARAGVGSLYSKDFYTLARTRLKPKGYVSQWLPAYQVPPETALAMIRAFIDVFPQAVLLSGSQAELLLLGANDATIQIDPSRLASALASRPAVEADLRRVDLGTIREIAGTFIGSAATLKDATRGILPVTDDRPLQEYSIRSELAFAAVSLPGATADLTGLRTWCPRCFAGDAPVPLAEDLDRYMAIISRAFSLPWTRVADFSDPRTARLVADSAYLRLVLRDAATGRNDIGSALAARGRWADAIAEFREALALDPDLSIAQRNLVSAQLGDLAKLKER